MEHKEDIAQSDSVLNVTYVPLATLKHPGYNPRQWSAEATKQLTDSIKRHGIVNPLLVNMAPGREGVVVGGNFRLTVLQELGYTEVPVIQIQIADLQKEKDLCIRLNKATGEWDMELLQSFGEAFLVDLGFSSEELDRIFVSPAESESFNVSTELDALKDAELEVHKGDVWQLGNSRLMCGDSMSEADMRTLMGGELADLCLTDPPYLLDSPKPDQFEAFRGKNNRDMKIELLPPDFTEKWMANIVKVQKADFSIIVFENWKSIPVIWQEMERYWTIRNMLVWHIQNRTRDSSARYRFLRRHTTALVGTASGRSGLNTESEEELLQNRYETALYATQGKPYWDGKKYRPTDFMEYPEVNEKHVGQDIFPNAKPVELLIPYIKTLTSQNGLVLEPFGGSGSTLIAAEMLKRRCYVMEKSPVYAEVIRKRWEKFTGLKASKVIYERPA